MQLNIALIPGDGIGPEIINSAIDVLTAVLSDTPHTLHSTSLPAGGVALDACGVPLPQSTLSVCLAADCVLLGAVGGSKWDSLPGHLRPERALLGLRKELGLYANLRPSKIFSSLTAQSPLKNAEGLDLLIVRELTGGIYFGESGRKDGAGGETAFDLECYSTAEIERIGRAAFTAAQGRRKQLCSVDKANVLESSRLWREVMHRLAAEYPEVAYSDMLVDNAAMQLVRAPQQFDVIVTTNLFGDILSDEAAQLTGSIGLLPSASLGENGRAMYEPIHGSAPDIAGRGVANPLATILSAAMLLRYSYSLEEAAQRVERAVTRALDGGLRTPDLGGDCNTAQMTQAVINFL